MTLDRRAFLHDTAAAAAALALPRHVFPDQSDLAPIFAQIDKRHDEAVQRLQEWIRQPSIAAEDRKSTRLNSSHSQISYAVFCLKKKKHNQANHPDHDYTPLSPRPTR